jgi:hypothetical protein
MQKISTGPLASVLLALEEALCTTGNSNSSMCAKTHRKIRISSEKYFTHKNIMIKKFCAFAVRYHFSVGRIRTEKLVSPRLKINFLCINPDKKKEINDIAKLTDKTK